MATSGTLRIGELSRRSGVRPELLRAWERRYGLLEPTRSAGGLRLYSPADVERVGLMRQYLADGLAAAEAAALARRAVAHGDGAHGDGAQPALRASAERAELAAALERFDEPHAQELIDRLLSIATVETLLAEIVLPYLHDLGERWQRGEVTVAQEHFAAGVLRGRLLGLARGWGLGVGPAAILACLPGERHDLGLIAFGLALRARGWRVVYLGPDTPVETIAETADRLTPTAIVLTAVTGSLLAPVLPQLRALAARHAVALGGAAAHDPAVARDGIAALADDPIGAAEQISRRVRA